MPLPFDRYPGDGWRLLRPPDPGDGSSRRGYGYDLQRETNQTSCAFCNLNLIGDYNRWLLLVVDHVLPVKDCQRKGLRNAPAKWWESMSNLIICCSGCNGFTTREEVEWEPWEDWSVQAFVRQRNRVFEERKKNVLKRRTEEMKFFRAEIKSLRTPISVNRIGGGGGGGAVPATTLTEAYRHFLSTVFCRTEVCRPQVG